MIITQMFLDAQVFLDFVEECKQYNIHVPVLPGIMCLNNFNGFQRMTALCKTRLPEGFMEEASKANTSDDAFKNWGIGKGVEMCRALLDGGAVGLHFYTLNLERVTVGILKGLGLITPEQAKVCESADKDAKSMISAQGIVGDARPVLSGNRSLVEADPVMAKLIEEERERQIRGIELIASENFTSRAVMECPGQGLDSLQPQGHRMGSECATLFGKPRKLRSLHSFASSSRPNDGVGLAQRWPFDTRLLHCQKKDLGILHIL